MRFAFGQCSFRTMDLQQHRILDEGVADPACHHDDGACPLCLANQVVDIDFGNRARRGEMRQRLDDRTRFRNIACAMSALRLVICLRIEALKRFAYDLATLVADDVKHVSDLEIASNPSSARKTAAC